MINTITWTFVLVTNRLKAEKSCVATQLQHCSTQIACQKQTDNDVLLCKCRMALSTSVDATSFHPPISLKLTRKSIAFLQTHVWTKKIRFTMSENSLIKKVFNWAVLWRQVLQPRGWQGPIWKRKAWLQGHNKSSWQPSVCHTPWKTIDVDMLAHSVFATFQPVWLEIKMQCASKQPNRWKLLPVCLLGPFRERRVNWSTWF